MRYGLAVLLLSSSAVLAQTPTTPPAIDSQEPETVYSEAELQRDRSIARETVTTVLEPAADVEDQYARWKAPVCINVYGLEPGSKFVVERRIREIGALVGAPINRNERCVPNVTIVITSDPDATLKSIHQARRELLLDYDMIAERLRQSQPIQAWYRISAQSNGRSIGGDNGFIAGNAEATTSISAVDGMSLPSTGLPSEILEKSVRFMSGEMSRLNTGITTAIQTVVIVANSNTIMGKSLGTMADHFAMLALAEIRPTRSCKEVPTIANLVHQDCDDAYRPDAITNNDLALLKALYQTPDDMMQRLQRARIIGNMRHNLEAQATRE